MSAQPNDERKIMTTSVPRFETLPIVFTGDIGTIRVGGSDLKVKVTSTRGSKNLKLVSEDGRNWKADRRSFKPTPRETFTSTAPPLPAGPAGLVVGSFVTFSLAAAPRYRGLNPGDVFVVIAVKAENTYNLAKAGGDAGRFWRTIPGSALVAYNPGPVS